MLSSGELFRACSILFGPEVDVSYDFLNYIQPAGIKTAYRRMARQTHPDALQGAQDEGATDSGRFIEVHWAYKRLINFISTRDTLSFGRHGRPRAHAAGAGSFARRQRPRRRSRSGARSDDGQRQGYYYTSGVPRRSLLFGEYLFYCGLIPWDALIKAIVWQRTQRPRLGEIARQWGWLTDQQILQCLRGRRLGEQFGQSALRQDHLSQAQLGALISSQRRGQRPFGEYFVLHSLLTRDELDAHYGQFIAHNTKYKGAQ